MVDDPLAQRVFLSPEQYITLWPKLRFYLRVRSKLLKEGNIFIEFTAFPQPALQGGTIPTTRRATTIGLLKPKATYCPNCSPEELVQLHIILSVAPPNMQLVGA